MAENTMHEISLEEIAKKFGLKGTLIPTQCSVGIDVLYMAMEE